MANDNNALWRRYRKNVLLAVPYRDLVVTRGKGAWLYDADGQRYLDFSSGQFSALFGHGDRELQRVLSDQLRNVAHTNDYLISDVVLQALADLAAIAPAGMQKALLLSTGAEANECAIRMAKMYTGRSGVVGFRQGYYGLTLATQSITKDGIHAEPRVPGSACIPVPDPRQAVKGTTLAKLEDECIEDARKVFGQHRGEVALCLLEPVLSAGGMIFPRRVFLERLSSLVKSEGALLAFDEAQTGLGRTGRWFAGPSRHAPPDMLILSKGIGCAMPVAAVIVRGKVAKGLEHRYLHFSSHQNDPLGAVAASYAIGRIKSDDLMRRITKMGRYCLRLLKEIEKESHWVVNSRGRGLMLAFDLEPAAFEEWRGYNAGFVLRDLLEQEGVLVQSVGRGRTFRLMPPYTIEEKEVHFFIEGLSRSLKKLSPDNPRAKEMDRRFHRSRRAGFYDLFHPSSH
jgi:2,2-dialkylglycine decarboxylase (pyruvate)